MFEVALYFFAGVGLLASLLVVGALLLGCFAEDKEKYFNPWD